jgi:hypothetical protein
LPSDEMETCSRVPWQGVVFCAVIRENLWLLNLNLNSLYP